MNRKLSFLERTLLFTLTFLLVVIVLSSLRIWQIDFQRYFLQAEKWPELIFLFALASALTMIFTKLLQWEFRIQARKK